MLKIIIPMVGEELYHKNSRAFFPKILNEVRGKTIFEYSQSYLKNFKESFENIYVRPSFANKLYEIDNIIQRVASENAKIINVNDTTAGALCTCLLAAEYWDDEDEIIISSADQFLDVNCQEIVSLFREKNTDVGLMSFSSVHPKWSYIKRDSFNSIIEVVEKKQ